jgi:Na+-transporting methylmalonyl-CoA/oxaloacetate decarboxylase gamma subunit
MGAMGENMQAALLISAIGMGIVFGVILILWGLMALVVRVAADRNADDPKAPVEADGAAEDQDANRRRAAAVVGAVAAAVERERAGDTAKAQAAAAAVAAYLADERRALGNGVGHLFPAAGSGARTGKGA